MFREKFFVLFDRARDGETLTQARLARRQPHWALQILIFLLVFLVSGLATGILVIAPVVAALFGNEAFLAAVSAGDVTAAIEASQQIVSGNGMTLLSLFLTVTETAAAIVYCRFIERRSLRSMGFAKKGFARSYGLGFLLGLLLLFASAGLVMLFGGLSFRLSPSISLPLLLAFLLGYLVQGMAEETLMRGYFMVSLANRAPLAVAVAVSSVLFSLLHLSNPGFTLLPFVNITLFGLFMALYVLRTDSLWGACALHSAWNFAQGNLLGFQVSGTAQTSSLLIPTDRTTALISGGLFGLEGGLAVTLVLVVAIALVVFLPRRERAA